MYKLFYFLLFVNHYCTKKKAATLESQPFRPFGLSSNPWMIEV